MLAVDLAIEAGITLAGFVRGDSAVIYSRPNRVRPPRGEDGVNPLPEAALLRYRNPQKPRGVAGRGTVISDQFVQIKVGGDQQLLQAIATRVPPAEEAEPEGANLVISA